MLLDLGSVPADGKSSQLPSLEDGGEMGVTAGHEKLPLSQRRSTWGRAVEGHDNDQFGLLRGDISKLILFSSAC